MTAIGYAQQVSCNHVGRHGIFSTAYLHLYICICTGFVGASVHFCSLQRGYSDCVKILETYGLKRLPSSVSIASQFQVPSSSTRTVDEYGHVPLLRPHHRMSLSSDSPSDHTMPSLSGPPLDRGTADGNDRISRPSSGFQQNENPVEMEMGIGMQLGIQGGGIIRS